MAEETQTEERIEAPNILGWIAGSRGSVGISNDADGDSFSIPQRHCYDNNHCHKYRTFDLGFSMDIDQIKYRQDIIKEGMEDGEIYQFMNLWLHWHPWNRDDGPSLKERLEWDKKIMDYLNNGAKALSNASSEGLKEAGNFLREVVEKKDPELKRLEELVAEKEKTKSEDVNLIINLNTDGKYNQFYIDSIGVNLGDVRDCLGRHSDLISREMYHSGGLGWEEALNRLIRGFIVNKRRVSDAVAARVHYNGDDEPCIEFDFEDTKGIFNPTTQKTTERRTLSDLLNCTWETIKNQHNFWERKEDFNEIQRALISKKGGIVETRGKFLNDYFWKKRNSIDFNMAEREVKDLSDQLSAYADVIGYAKRLKEDGPLCFSEILPSNEDRTEIIKGVNPMLLRRSRWDDKKAAVANSYIFSPENKIKLITGAVAGGKTTYAEGLALLQLMAQSGLPVPAESAKFSLRDGAYVHKVSSGDCYNSRFQFEMGMVNKIFDSATPNSLIILDEPCGSTAHSEGLELSKGLVEGVRRMGAQCIYVTHMHELADYVDERKYGENLHCEYNDGKPTYHIKKGKAGSSHSISLASKYGLDKDSLIKRLDERAVNNWERITQK